MNLQMIESRYRMKDLDINTVNIWDRWGEAVLTCCVAVQPGWVGGRTVQMQLHDALKLRRRQVAEHWSPMPPRCHIPILCQALILTSTSTDTVMTTRIFTRPGRPARLHCVGCSPWSMNDLLDYIEHVVFSRSRSQHGRFPSIMTRWGFISTVYSPISTSGSISVLQSLTCSSSYCFSSSSSSLSSVLSLFPSSSPGSPSTILMLTLRNFDPSVLRITLSLIVFVLAWAVFRLKPLSVCLGSLSLERSFGGIETISWVVLWRTRVVLV